MRQAIGKALMLAGAAWSLPAAVIAQEVRDLDSETAGEAQTYTGAVENAPVVFAYTVAPGTALRIDVVPAPGSPLDPVLLVTDAVTGEVLAEDDDGGQGLASLARIHSEQGQRIEISVSAYDLFDAEDAGGAFELTLRRSSFTPVPPREIRFGGEVSDALEPGESHEFHVTGRKGALLQVAVVAGGGALDPTLELYRGRGPQGEPMAADDDGGGDLNSLLRHVLPEDGTYTIIAAPFEGTSGDYVLRVAEEQYPEVQPPVQVIGLDESLSGRLGEGYEFGSIDPARITYRLSEEAISAIRAGTGEVTINMVAAEAGTEGFSGSLDPYLELGFETPVGFASLVSDDDGGGNLNSRVALDLSPIVDEPGWLEMLRIHAETISGGGAYSIELVEGLQPVEQGYEGWQEADALEVPPLLRSVRRGATR